MKKLALISACILGLVFAGSAVNPTPKKKEPVKTEVKKDAVKMGSKENKADPKKGMKVEKMVEAKKK
jgi:hypothetical protein